MNQINNHVHDVYLAILRHGEYEQPKQVPSALLPHPLTENGRTQAVKGTEKILEFVEKYHLDVYKMIDTSRLLRSFETGTIIAKELTNHFNQTFTVSEFDHLAERSVGAVANLTIEQIETILDQDPRYGKPVEGWKSNSWYKLPFMGAESLMESGLRVAHHFQACADELESYPKPHLKIVVGHGASIRHAALTLGLLKSSDIPKYSMHHAEPIFFKRVNGQWSKVEGEWKIRAAAKEGID